MPEKGLSTDLNRPELAIMDPELTFTLPPYQTAAGVIEQAFFHTPGAIIESDNIKLPGDRTLENPGNMIKTLLLRPGNLPAVISVNWQECLMSAVLPCTVIEKYGLDLKVGKED